MATTTFYTDSIPLWIHLTFLLSFETQKGNYDLISEMSIKFYTTKMGFGNSLHE